MIERRGPIRSKAFVLYAGEETPHRSCGIALAEAFDRPTAAYQSLRRGGITGEGTCGAVVAGQLLLGEFLGDPDPTGKVTPALRGAMEVYLRRVRGELDRGESPDLVCKNMTAPRLRPVTSLTIHESSSARWVASRRSRSAGTGRSCCS